MFGSWFPSLALFQRQSQTGISNPVADGLQDSPALWKPLKGGNGLQGKGHSFVVIDVLSEQPEGFYKE